jgi:hypothetical protein
VPEKPEPEAEPAEQPEAEQPAAEPERVAEAPPAGEPAAEPEEPPQPPVAAEPEAPAPLLESEPRVSLATPQAGREELAVALPAPRPLEPERPEAEGSRLAAPAEEAPLELVPATPPVELPKEGPAETAEAEGPAEGAAPKEPAEGAAAPEAVAAMEAEPEAAEPQPPVEERVATAAPSVEPAAVAPQAGTLPSQTYFLQLGAYSSRSLAEKLARDVGPNYQVSILPTSDRDRTIYKVLIGPLNTDESGTLLYLFKARGFKDAFLRYVE